MIDNVKERLWNVNFLLLWQGQFVSALGDVAYEIALGFWVLATTGSTALMGTLMAASAIPRVLVSPFAGVWVDRLDRRRLIVLMDLVRGFVVTLVGIAALAGVVRLWMVFGAGIVMGLGAAFFNPAVGSVIPDITHRDNVVRANSFFSMIHTGSGVLGNTVGGYLYSVVGAPVLFLVNGLSYLISSLTEAFLRIPRVLRAAEKRTFWADLRNGVRFAWGIRGLRYLFVMAGAANFLATVAFVLFLPLFQQSARLGPVRYGVAMAVLAAGMFLGMVFTAAVRVPPTRRFSILAVGLLVMCVCFSLFPLWESLPVMLSLALLGGASNSLINVMVGSVMQLTVPQAMRGKVMGFLSTLSQGLTPIAMALGGVLGELLPIRWVIFACFLAMAAVSVPLLRSSDFRSFIGYAPKPEPGGQAPP
jgi:MFS family permease